MHRLKVVSTVFLFMLVVGYISNTKALSDDQKTDNGERSTNPKIMKRRSDRRATREVEDLFEENDQNAMTFIFDQNMELMQESQYIILEGDINLGRKMAHNALRDTSKLWRDGIVYYSIDERFESDARERILVALGEFEKTTCLQFKERTDENDYVKFTTDKGCSSAVGRSGGMQIITIGGNCNKKLGSILHEIMHAIGFHHEQSRTDRDEYVEILLQNVFPGFKQNFDLYDHKLIDPLGAPYDYGSLLHYPEDAFIKRAGTKTIIPKKKTDVKLGQCSYFSEVDLYKINKLYKCDTTTDVGTGEDGGNEIDTQECFTEDHATDYRGTVAVSMSGRTCRNWAELDMEDEQSDLGNHNYCRNPDHDSSAWCYVGNGEDFEYEYCDIGKKGDNCQDDGKGPTAVPTQSPGQGECYVDPIGQDYRGTVSSTRDGVACQAWSDQYPHEHDYGSLVDGEHNYCRNPDGDENGAWCFQLSVDRPFGYCDIGQPAEYCQAAPQTCSYEANMDRLGSDIYGVPEKVNSREECCSLCWSDPQCIAWTFEKNQGPRYGNCWLKDTIPVAVESDCCDSGIQENPKACTVRENIDRPGAGINNGNMNKVGSALACCNSCWYNPTCVAWTFDKREGSTFGNCWLKDDTPDPVEASCCDSGLLGY
ncbi:uncharacterized protein LOC144447737 [Glandiceps talaboti]